MSDIHVPDGEDPEPPRLTHAASVGLLATATAEGLEDLTIAARDSDETAARRVLRRSRRRRAARADAELAVRRDLTRPDPASGALRRAACELQLISLLAQVGDLVDAFARQLAAGRTPRPLLDARARPGNARRRGWSSAPGDVRRIAGLTLVG